MKQQIDTSQASVRRSITTLLTDVEVAEMLGVSISTVRRWRLFGNQGPKWIRVSKSAIRYRAEDLRAYVESRPSGGEQPVEAR